MILSKFEKSGRRVFWSVIFPLAAFILILSQPHRASAQWTTPDVQGNITNTNSGKIAIGGFTPSLGKLEIRGDDGVAAGEHSLVYASRSGQGSGGIKFGYRTDGTQVVGGFLRGLSNLPFYIGTTATPQALTITDNGNFGFGTIAPSAKLQLNGTGAFNIPGSAEFRIYNTTYGSGFTHHVGDTGNWQLADLNGNTKVLVKPGTGGDITLYGNVIVTGNIAAKYQDVAEWVPALHAMPAGTVVILDSGRDNHVTESSVPYDTRVAGVISAQPGIALGEGGEGKVLVATTGRVHVLVDATRASIHVGDLLVTSEKPGVAMRSQPLDLGGVPIHRPGTLIGKALESLDKGTGEILVLLSLQ
jgi:hypothetical protein